jgi:hypothetical protein
MKMLLFANDGCLVRRHSHITRQQEAAVVRRKPQLIAPIERPVTAGELDVALGNVSQNVSQAFRKDRSNVSHVSQGQTFHNVSQGQNVSHVSQGQVSKRRVLTMMFMRVVFAHGQAPIHCSMATGRTGFR